MVAGDGGGAATVPRGYLYRRMNYILLLFHVVLSAKLGLPRKARARQPPYPYVICSIDESWILIN